MFEGCSGCCLTIVLVPLLCICLAACGVIYVTTSAPEPPVAATFVPNPIAATNLEQKIEVLKLSSGGQFSLEFNELEISSWVALEGLEVIGVGDGTLPLENAQVGLDDGEMSFYGVVTDLGVDVPIKLAMKPSVDPSGHLVLDITEANVGGVGLPDVVLKHVINEFDDLLVKPLDELRGSYQITELRIDNGNFVMRGWVIN